MQQTQSCRITKTIASRTCNTEIAIQKHRITNMVCISILPQRTPKLCEFICQLHTSHIQLYSQIHDNTFHFHFCCFASYLFTSTHSKLSILCCVQLADLARVPAKPASFCIFCFLIFSGPNRLPPNGVRTLHMRH